MKYWNANKQTGIDKEKVKGNTYTHSSVSEFILSFIDFDSVTADTKFLEPAVGAGSFIFPIIDILLTKGYTINHIMENMIWCADNDDKVLEYLITELETRYNYLINDGTKIFPEDFLMMAHQEFDYIITNPPYISNKNISFDPARFESKEHYIDTIRAIDSRIDRKSDLYVYFYIKSMKMLKENGKLIFLCSDSWVDTNFGDIIKEYISTDYSMELILNNQVYPFFRDDTNAILTVISRSVSDTELIINRQETFHKDGIKVPRDVFINVLRSDLPNVRNALILFPDKYPEVDNFFQGFQTVKDRYTITTTSLSQSTLAKDNLIEDHVAGNVPLFWQIQARVNRPPNYKNAIYASELQYTVKPDIPDKLRTNIMSDTIYMSSIIDRFPLVFKPECETFHISKYLSIRRNDRETTMMDVMDFTNVFTMLNMELILREGTRKTLRKGEYGLAKEIRKEDLYKVKIPTVDYQKVKDKIDNLSKTVLYNIEHALVNDDYLAIQKHIAKEMDVDLQYAIDELLFLYSLRMRNIENIKNVTEYQNRFKL